MNKDLFEKENRLYKYYINRQEENRDAKSFVKSLFNLGLLNSDKSAELDLVKLYQLLGFDTFFSLIEEWGGKTIKLPKVEQIKKILLISLAVYYVDVLGLKPGEAGKVLGDQLSSSSLKQRSVKNIVKSFEAELSNLFKTYSEAIED